MAKTFNTNVIADKLSEVIHPFQLKELSDKESRSALFSKVIPQDTEVVLMGESTHGTEDYYTVRSHLTRHLIEHQGFRVVLIEAEWPDVYVLNQYITTKTGLCSKPKEALSFIQGHGRHMWQNYAFAELLEWMKEYNARKNFRAEEMVYLFGIDCQQIYRSLRVLYDTLAEIDFNLCCEIKATFSFFNGHTSEWEYARATVGSVGSEQIPSILQKVMSDWQWTHFDALKKKTPTSHLIDLINIEQNLEVIINGEEYFRKRQLEPPGSQASWNTRDQHMFLTLNRLKERLPSVIHAGNNNPPPVKLIAWAHNSHIGDASATERGGQDFLRNETWNLGQMVKKNYDRSYLLGFDTFSGTVTALSGKDTAMYDLRPAVENSVGYYCHQVCEKKNCTEFYLDLTQELEDPELAEFLSSRLYHRYVGVNYVPETEMKSHYSLASLAGQYSGLIFIDTTRALNVMKNSELTPPPTSGKANNSVAAKRGQRRLMQEYRDLMVRNPIPHIRVSPQEDNLWICHFVMTFNFGDYEGGEYHGRLEIPQDYPMAPPRIFFMTPSGRFETETRICVSFSDYHPELWNPSWGLSSVLVGLQSFMQEDSPGSLGSIQTSRKLRRELAAKSHEFNLKNQYYRQLFVDREPETPETVTGMEVEEKEEEKFCRYCRQSGGELVSPCNCAGGNKYVHVNCLAKWQYKAILSQSTHPKYQTGLEKKCNVCLSEFKIQQFTREQLMLTFTGAEIANLIQVGSQLIATEKSSEHNLRLMEQYSHLIPRLSYWTKAVFLITSIKRYSTKDGNYDESIEGVGLSREIPKKTAKRLSSYEVSTLNSQLKPLNIPCRHFIGGPVSPTTPFVVLVLKTSKFNEDEFGDKFQKIAFFQQEDMSLWYVPFDYLMSIFSKRGPQRISLIDALIGIQVFWGCARWGRVQLLGEIARGGWGLAPVTPEFWSDPVNCWGKIVKRAVVAGKNDMSSD